jgi:hypothetical protein
MSNKISIYDLLNSLAEYLKPDKCVIFGSSAIVLHDVPFRNANDLDVFVSDDTFNDMLPHFPVTYKDGQNGEKIPYIAPKDGIEILKTFPGVQFTDVLFNAACTPHSRDFLVASLPDVIRWKTAQGRNKDLEDIKDINKFLTA